MTTDDNKPIIIKLPYASIIQLLTLSNRQGYLVHLGLQQEQNALQDIKNVEESCINDLVTNNDKWFRNSLDEKTIREMFQSTVEQDIVLVYISLLRSHLNIENTDIPEWFNSIKNNLPKSYYITLVCDGLFIYPTRFGLRWIVHSVKDFKEETEEIVPDYEDIIQYWEEKVNASKKKLISRLNKIESIMNQIKKKEFSEKEIEELIAIL